MEKRADSPYRFPRIWPGYLMGLLMVIGEAMYYRLNPDYTTGEGTAIGILLFELAGTIFLLGCLIYWLVCVYKIHQILFKLTDSHYPISPGKAVRYMFIPFYNLYWAFKFPSEIVSFVNSRDTSRKLKTWVPGLFMFLGMAAGRVTPILWCLTTFAVLAYLVRMLKRVVDLHHLEE